MFRVRRRRPRRRTQVVRESPPRSMACRLLPEAPMSLHPNHPSTAWTVPLHLIMWATIIVGLVMMLIILMRH